MAKYTEDIKKTIYEMYSSGEYLINEICKSVGITRETWRKWRVEKSDFSDLLKKADKQRIENKRLLATKGLTRLLKGETFTEVTKELIKGKMTTTKKVKKVFRPNTTAVIFALKNLDKETFGEVQTVKHIGGDKEDAPIRIESREDLIKEIARLKTIPIVK